MLLDLINKFNKFPGCKTNIQKISCIYITNNKLSERKAIIASKNNKIFRNKFNHTGERSVHLKL